MWQFTSTATAPGISGNVDADVFNGDLNAMRAMMVPETVGIGLVLAVTVLIGRRPRRFHRK